MNELDMETKVVGIAAPTTLVWAVFGAEEGDDEIWTERVHLWEHTRTVLPPDRVAEVEFLARKLPPVREKIQGFVLCEGDLVLVSEAEGLFLGYSENEKPRPEDWCDAIKRERRFLARRMAG